MARKGAPKHARRYPWERWFKTGEFVLVRGRDYHYRSYIMDRMLRRAAMKHGLRVSVKTSEDESCLFVRVWNERLEAVKRRTDKCQEKVAGVVKPASNVNRNRL